VKDSYSDKIEDLVNRIKDDDLRAMMRLCNSKKKMPRESINDGGIDKMCRIILRLEHDAAKNNNL